MGWSNGPKTWSELEARLSDGPRRVDPQAETAARERSASGRVSNIPSNAQVGESPAWSRKRSPYIPAVDTAGIETNADAPAYAELHCHSNFSFLDGASHPEELVEEAVRLGLSALALTDHDGLYGVVRFAEAARAYGLPTVFGAEVTLHATSSAQQRVGNPDPDGEHLVVLATDPIGYGRLARTMATSHLAAGEKGAPQLLLEQLGALAEGSTVPFHEALRRGPSPEMAVAGDSVLAALQIRTLHESVADEAAIDEAINRHPSTWARAAEATSPAEGYMSTGERIIGPASRNHWKILTGCRKGAVAKALVEEGPRAAARELDRLIDIFGHDSVIVELWDHGDPLDAIRNDGLAQLAARSGVDLIATNNVHYATPSRRPLATALAAVKARRSLDEVDGWLPASAGAHLRSGAEQLRRFRRYPGAVQRAAELASACAFDLKLVAPQLPPYPCPDGMSEMVFLRALSEKGAERRYGKRKGVNGDDSERVPGAYRQIDHELDLIAQLGFAGYFLVVWDLVEFCRRSNIFCQGRGSAANSAVCYALGVTNADAVSLGLLFERFLSPERDGPPDIDIDIESGRREEVIQYVYARYGRERAAQVANVITYRSRSAIRDMGRALGHAPGRLDAWSKQVDPWGRVATTEALGGHDIPESVLALAKQVEDFPRHLGIHSGGMVICDRPVVEVCPVEWGRFTGRDNNSVTGTTPLRTVLQWDKDDCAAAGLVKFDLLGLGMLSALHNGVDLIREYHGVNVDIALIPQEDDVYDMICQADTVGVFQIESRAQMATLPRLRPRTFYDLVVEIALIRPGPIQGGSVHPYIRRRNGLEPVTYLHPLLEKSLKKTLGIPLFQEQLMQMSIDVANFSPSEADQLRQAMGSKRSNERMERLKQRLFEGMRANGITEDVAVIIYDKLAAFANYGFPESHSVSFAYLVYASSWMKHHYPAAFCAALLNAQPMGFYSPQSLTADARRHGVTVFGPDINASLSGASLSWERPELCNESGYPVHQPALRLGLSDVRVVGGELARRIEKERASNGEYRNLGDLVRRVDPGMPALESLATAGAFNCFGMDRRKALWAVGAAGQARPDRLAGIVTGEHAPALPGMAPVEIAAADLWATGVTLEGYPTELVRTKLNELGIITSAGLRAVEHGRRIWVGGVVTHRQRPATAGGTTFINLEDETGLINIICSKGVWAKYRRVARGASALMVRGICERMEMPARLAASGTDGADSSASDITQATCVINIVADRLEPLWLSVQPGKSRDFH
jgi:error-prone DNA polymerase